MDKVTVIQADREAAAAYFVHTRSLAPDDYRVEQFKKAQRDDSFSVQAFAAHRLATPAPDSEKLREVGQSMDDAPTDGTMIRLLVDYTDGGGALEDEHPQSWTIGFNNLGNTGEDRWQFAGWSWEQDVFCEGSGKPVGWLPWSNPSAGGDVS